MRFAAVFVLISLGVAGCTRKANSTSDAGPKPTTASTTKSGACSWLAVADLPPDRPWQQMGADGKHRCLRGPKQIDGGFLRYTAEGDAAGVDRVIVSLGVRDGTRAKSAQRELADLVSAITTEAFGASIEEGDRDRILAAESVESTRIAGRRASLARNGLGATYTFDVTIELD